MSDQNPQPQESSSDAPHEASKSPSLTSPTPPADDANLTCQPTGGEAILKGTVVDGGGESDQPDVAAVMRLLQETLPRLSSGAYHVPQAAPPVSSAPSPPSQVSAAVSAPPQVSTAVSVPRTSILLESKPPVPLHTVDSATKDLSQQTSPTRPSFSPMYTSTTPVQTTILPIGISSILTLCQPFSNPPQSPTVTQPPGQIFTYPANQILTQPPTQIAIQPSSTHDSQPSLRAFPESTPQASIQGSTQSTPHTLAQGFAHSPPQTCCVGTIHTARGMSPLACRQSMCVPYSPVETSPLLKASNRSAVGMFPSEVAGGAGTGGAPHQESQDGGATQGRRYCRFTKRQVVSLASLLIVDFFAFASISIMAPFFPQQAQKLGVGRTLNGIIFSVYSLVLVVASPIVGKILPLLRLRDVYITGITITGLANICFGMVAYLHDADVFVVMSISLRVVGALGASCFLTVIYALIPILFPDDMNTVNGMLETSIGLGMCVGPAVGVWLYAVGGFSLPFYSLGSFILLIVPISYVTFPDDEIAIIPSRWTRGMWWLLSRPGATLPLLILSSTAVCIATLYPTLQPHMSRLGVSVEGVGLVYLMLSAVYAVSSPLVGLATDRYGSPSGFMFVGLLLMALSYILIGNSPLLPSLPHDELYNQDMVGIVVLGLASAMCIVPTYGVILQAAASQGESADIATFSVVGGLWSAAYSLGEMLGPLYAGMITSYLSFATSTTFTALLPLSLALVLGAYMCTNRLYNKTQ
ncbi:MFS-type transporter SLC18B1-like isoform X2 [Panulirus ornatus]|uniref:MFS-type transporter SLC18B1-like isoform X2 n=1 Tax=Panulirus ornatus TaxID=150431 RepID=UPI003A85F005